MIIGDISFHKLSQISENDTIDILERQYAVTDGISDRPVLVTGGILSCIGILFYDKEKKSAGLAHLQDYRFLEYTIAKLTNDLKRKSCKNLQGYLIRQEIPQNLNDIVRVERSLIEKGLIKSDFVFIKSGYCIFDTRTGLFYNKRGLTLTGNRPYDKTRYSINNGVMEINHDPMSDCLQRDRNIIIKILDKLI